MSEHTSPQNPFEAQRAAAASAIFKTLHERIKSGDYISASTTEPAMYCSEVPEFSFMCLATIDADDIDNPTLIKMDGHKVTSPIAVNFWIQPDAIEVRHFGYDDHHDPHPLNQRHPIDAEELVDLYSKFFPEGQ